MLLSPYLFKDPESPTLFHQAVDEYKAWYFWAMVAEQGTALAHTTVTTAQDGICYFIIDPSVDNHPIISPEDFLSMLTGHEEGGKFWGYSWTIREMVINWHLLIQSRHEPPYSVNDYAMKINYAIQKIDIIPKSHVWESIEEINF
jgi:hypothetical protein